MNYHPKEYIMSINISNVIESQIILIEAEMNALYQNTEKSSAQTKLLLIMEQYSNALDSLENEL